MSKAPSFQFYPSDWLSAPEVRRISPMARGIWIDLLCFMWKENEQGKLTCTIFELARMTGATLEEAIQFLREAQKHELCDLKISGDVTNGHTEVTLVNRRMHSEWKEKESARLRKQKQRKSQGCPTSGHTEVTSYSSSSSSTSKTEKTEEPPIPPVGVEGGESLPPLSDSDPEPEQFFDPEDIPSLEFEQFFDAYPKQVDKAKAWNAWRKLGRVKPGLASLQAAIVEQSQSDQWTRDHGRYIPSPAKWLAERKWLDKLSPAPTSPAAGQTSDADWKRYAGSCVKEKTL